MTQRQKEISNSLSNDLVSLVEYKPNHFEILGEKYKNNDPLSEEDIWIPIKRRLG